MLKKFLHFALLGTCTLFLFSCSYFPSEGASGSATGPLPEVIGPDGKIIGGPAAEGMAPSSAQPGVAPATASIPTPTAATQSFSNFNQNQKIALLLPLNGPLASSGQAVRNGFFAAYSYAKSQNPNLPAVKVYDTSLVGNDNLYNKALADGASFIVGPLAKPEVNNLFPTTAPTVPVLALNTLDDYQSRQQTNFYQFGLAPQDEAVQIAQKAIDDKARNALLIFPQSSWGENLSSIIKTSFTNSGGKIIDQLAYNSDQNLGKQLGTLLGTDQSQQRATALGRTIHRKVKFSLRRRQDFDVIFLVANPDAARQIRPLLKFYYAGEIPVYATSLVYAGTPNPAADTDLDDIIFCDMPWVLSKPESMPPYIAAAAAEINKESPNANASQNKLYALGIDAYNILGFLTNNAGNFPSNGIAGASGVLYLDQYHHIYRRLTWAKFVNGTPTP